MSNFTAEQIIKINEIFSRVVDCKGNLKVFNGAWDKIKDSVAICVEDNKNKDKPKAFDENKLNSSNPIYKNKIIEYYNGKNNGAILDICIKGNIIDYKNINDIKFTIGDIQKEPIDTHFSSLLYKFDILEKEDFAILYGAFYDVLAICGYDFNSSDNHTILYLNIFQRLIDYFKDGKINFDVKDGNVKQIDNILAEKLKEIYEINKLFCKIKTSQNLYNLNDDEKLIFKKYGYLVKVAVFVTSIEKCPKNMIFYGAPGTGKTKFVKDCLDILDPNRARTEWVQFHSGFEYEDFIDGIKPNAIQNGNLNLALTNGIFKEFCLKAAQNEKENFFFIVDEINRADIAAVFGETLSLLEENYRGKSIKTKNYALSKQEFSIPSNVYFIGMMNDVDKSIDCFDLALRRRFAWVLMECDYGVVENATDKDYKVKCENLNNYITNDLKYLVEYEDETRVKIKSIQSYDNAKERDEDYDKLFQNITDEEKENNKKRYEKTNDLNLGRAYEIGHSYFLKKETTDEKEIWARHIEPILREYIRTQFGDGEVEKKLETAKKIFVG